MSNQLPPIPGGPIPILGRPDAAKAALGRKVMEALQRQQPPEAEEDASPSQIPWKPTRNHVIVRRVKRQRTESGRLFLPDNAEAEENVGMVEEAGPEVEDKRIAPGAFVLLGEWGGTRVQIKDPGTGEHKTLLVLEESEVLAVWEAGHDEG